MAFSSEELIEIQQKIASFLADLRPEKEIRKELDYHCSIDGQSIILYEVRPLYFDPTRISRMEIAKTTYVKKTRVWKIYWMRGNGKWELYYIDPEVSDLESFFKIVKEDESFAFFG